MDQMQFYSPDEFLPKLNIALDDLSKKVKIHLPHASIEHIGSSAIAGAISKGDLDVLVIVSKDKFNESISVIESMGFNQKEGTLRTDQLCMLETANYNMDVAIQLIEAGSEFEDFKTFRDILNSNPSLVLEYNQLKLTCSGLTPVEYREKKSQFLIDVLKG